MENKIKLIWILSFLLAVSITVSIKFYVDLKDLKDAIKPTNDSVFVAQIDSLNTNTDYHKHIADSLSLVLKSVSKQRVIIRNIYLDETNEVVYYSPMRRNAVLDSIFRSGGVK